MKLVFDARGLEVDPWLEDFVRAHAVFATWWGRAPRVESVRVLLEPLGPEGDAGPARCAFEAAVPGRGPVLAGATGGDLCEAIREAADLLELSLLRPFGPASPSAQPRLAA